MEATPDDGPAAWEVSKENIQPMKRGRRMAALGNALAAAEPGGAAARAAKEAREARMRCVRPPAGRGLRVPRCRAPLAVGTPHLPPMQSVVTELYTRVACLLSTAHRAVGAPQWHGVARRVCAHRARCPRRDKNPRWALSLFFRGIIHAHGKRGWRFVRNERTAGVWGGVCVRGLAALESTMCTDGSWRAPPPPAHALSKCVQRLRGPHCGNERRDTRPPGGLAGVRGVGAAGVCQRRGGQPHPGNPRAGHPHSEGRRPLHQRPALRQTVGHLCTCVRSRGAWRRGHGRGAMAGAMVGAGAGGDGPKRGARTRRTYFVQN